MENCVTELGLTLDICFWYMENWGWHFKLTNAI